MKASRGALTVLLTVVVVFLLGVNLSANDSGNGDDNNNKPGNSKKVDADKQVMDLKGYPNRVSIPAIYAHLFHEIENSNDFSKTAERTNQVKYAHYFETLYMLLTRMHMELMEASSKGFVNAQYMSFDTMLNAVNFILEKQVKRPIVDPSIKQVNSALIYQKAEVADIAVVLRHQFMVDHASKDMYFKGGLAKLNRIAEMMQLIEVPFPRLPEESYQKVKGETTLLNPIFMPEDVEIARAEIESRFYRDLSLEQARERFDRFERHLEENIIEQPEAVRVLRAFEESKYLIAERKAPEVLVLMGLPGTGKDTIAEAYAKALFPTNPRADLDHLYRVQVLRTQADQWSELGSATGYVGSGEFPAILDFIIKHSGGRYIKKEKRSMSGGVSYYIQENSKWQGHKLPGTLGPEDATVFLNEFHDWSYMNKNEFAKEFLEKGIITVNNPNGGIKKLHFPCNVIVASNDGIDLVADRHVDGRPRGQRKTYEQLMDAWAAIQGNLPLLRSTFMKTKQGTDQGPDRKGTSEEMVSRFQNIIYLRPLSAEGLRKVVGIHLNGLKKQYAKMNEKVGSIKLRWTDAVLEFVQSYMYEAEEAARPMKQKVDALIRSTFNKVVMRGDVVDNQKEADVLLDVIKNEDGTTSLKVTVEAEDQKREVVEHIQKTEEVKLKEPLSDREIEDIIDLERRINEQVFGVKHIAKKLTKAVLNAKIRANENEKLGASKDAIALVFGFFGLSSTGKTELTKVLGKEMTGSKENVWYVDANFLQSQHLWDEKFGYDQADPTKRSEFQKEYDRRQGKLVVVIDELANVRDRNLLKNLYAYFDEPVVGGRNMKDVVFVVTGNAGEEWYQGVPKDLPESIRHFSMQEIYKQAIKNTGQQESLLLNYFPEALMKRIGMQRVFFFSPLDFADIRRLFILKLKGLFKRTYSPKKQTHWWDVYFASQKEANKIVTVMEKEGFTLDGQGRSVHRFVEESFAQSLNEFLLRNKVPIGAKVELSLDHDFVRKYLRDQADDYGEHKKGLYLHVKTDTVEGSIFVQGKAHEHFPEHTKVSKIITAYHEAGHELTRKVFLGDRRSTRGISIIPGVTQIGAEWIVYAGIAKSEETTRMRYTEAALLREMSVLFGGEVAETLVTKDYRHGEGKSNDIERATQMARSAILAYGLSEKFGRHAAPPGMKLEDFMATLSPGQLEIYESEMKRYLDEARKLAEEALLVNWDTFVDMGKTLAEKGDMSGKDVEKVYKRNKKHFLTEWDAKTSDKYIELADFHFEGKFQRTQTGKPKFGENLSHSVAAAVSQATRSGRSSMSRDAEILHESLMPKKLMNIQKLIEKHMDKARRSVPAEGLPLGAQFQNGVGGSCKTAF